MTLHNLFACLFSLTCGYDCIFIVALIEAEDLEWLRPHLLTWSFPSTALPRRREAGYGWWKTVQRGTDERGNPLPVLPSHAYRPAWLPVVETSSCASLFWERWSSMSWGGDDDNHCQPGHRIKQSAPMPSWSGLLLLTFPQWQSRVPLAYLPWGAFISRWLPLVWLNALCPHASSPVACARCTSL